MTKINYSVLQKNNIDKNIAIKLINDKQLVGKLKGYSNYEIYIEKDKELITINKGSIIYMYVR